MKRRGFAAPVPILSGYRSTQWRRCQLAVRLQPVRYKGMWITARPSLTVPAFPGLPRTSTSRPCHFAIHPLACPTQPGRRIPTIPHLVVRKEPPGPPYRPPACPRSQTRRVPDASVQATRFWTCHGRGIDRRRSDAGSVLDRSSGVVPGRADRDDVRRSQEAGSDFPKELPERLADRSRPILG